jgi:sugar phosphate isomerase/epimerase
MVSDIVLLKELPEAVKESVAAYVGCIAGAVKRAEYLDAIKASGFEGIEVVEEKEFPVKLMANDPAGKAVMESMDLSEVDAAEVGGTVASVSVHAVKPL